jgi:hypothetical protein
MVSLSRNLIRAFRKDGQNIFIVTGNFFVTGFYCIDNCEAVMKLYTIYYSIAVELTTTHFGFTVTSFIKVD